jgi:hypothetical protein
MNSARGPRRDSFNSSRLNLKNENNENKKGVDKTISTLASNKSRAEHKATGKQDVMSSSLNYDERMKYAKSKVSVAVDVY